VDGKFLEDVQAHQVFRTCNGVVIRNLSELASYAECCSDYDFRYHVNDDHHKNDFAIWVREAVGDETLANDLDAELDRTQYARLIKKRLRALLEGGV